MMEEEKVFHDKVENELMSLAHEILSKHKRMSLSEVKAKAERIITFIDSNDKIEKFQHQSSSALDDLLDQPDEEIKFESIKINFADTLFNGNNVDFQRVISMLNSKESAKEAQKFIIEQIQPDYQWDENDLTEFINHISTLYTD